MKRVIKWFAVVLVTLIWVIPPEGGSVLAHELPFEMRASTIEKDFQEENSKTRSLPKMQFFYNQDRIVK